MSCSGGCGGAGHIATAFGSRCCCCCCLLLFVASLRFAILSCSSSIGTKFYIWIKNEDDVVTMRYLYVGRTYILTNK
jgi:hypothetical protein